MAAKVDNLNNDLAEVQNSMADLTTQMNRVQQQLTDINNAIKVLQAPPAPLRRPRTVQTRRRASGARTSPAAPRCRLVRNASSDYSSGKSDLAAEFADFVHYYPDDPIAPDAQFYIGQIHLVSRSTTRP